MKKEELIFSYEKLLNYLEGEHLKEDVKNARKSFAGTLPVRASIKYYGIGDVNDPEIYFKEDRFVVKDYHFSCEVFKDFHNLKLKSFLFYLVTCPGQYESRMSIGELGYFMVQNRCLDFTRNIIRNNLKIMTEAEQVTQCGTSENIWYSGFIGPGYYEMPLADGKKIYELLQGERLGIIYSGDTMNPAMSVCGMIFGVSGNVGEMPCPCTYCLGAQNDKCRFCGGL